MIDDFFSKFRENTVWLPWIFFGALAVLCGLLAIIQSRWIDQIGNAQRQRMQTALQSNLARLSTEFDEVISKSCAEMVPPFSVIEGEGTEKACARQYGEWKTTHGPVFQTVAIVLTGSSRPELLVLDLDSGEFKPAPWPDAWRKLRDRFMGSPSGEKGGDPNLGSTVFALPLYGSLHRVPGESPDDRDGPGPSPPQEDWLILDLNPRHVAEAVLPELMAKHLDEPYLAQIESDGSPPSTILKTGDSSFKKEDASVKLLDPTRLAAGGWRERRGPEAWDIPLDLRQPSWRLLVRRSGTSVDDAVLVVRWRNIALSVGLLILMLTMVGALFHYSRRANQLANMQMKFVAGVSHDLRTPLTVIRTAAFNLKGKIATRPEQVEKYGELIQQESEKLTRLVEQVLRFNSLKARHILRAREAVMVEALIESSLESSLAVPAGRGVVVERQIEADLPPVLGDQLALKHALQNLFDNAVKYGLEGSNWIGVSASAILEESKSMVEIRVADRGPGILVKERDRIFEAFVRGESAVQDHVQGTGLGLNIVRTIAEAHGGSVHLAAQTPRGTIFILRLPVAPMELEDAVADFAG